MLLDELEAQITALVSRIAKLEPLEDLPAAFASLDKELIGAHAHLRDQCDAARQIEQRRETSQDLDAALSTTLIALAEYRKQLETRPSDTKDEFSPLDSQVLLDYASRITRFTRQMPGTIDPTVLPWPAEDQLRRGMLATLVIQEEAGPQGDQEEAPQDMAVDEPAAPAPESQSASRGENQVEGRSERQPRAEPRKRAPKKKINLDFDSDDD